MERKEFLALLGSSTASLLVLGCLGGCSKSESDAAAPGGNPGTGTNKVDFTLDLNTPTNAPLKTKGNAVVSNKVIVAYSNAGTYLAVAALCTHQNGNLGYDAAGNKFSCPLHGSNFGADGAVINGPATTALKQYKTTLNGTNLRIYE